MELNLKPALSMTHVVFVRISHASTTWLQDDRDSKFGPHLIRQSVDSRLSAEELPVPFILFLRSGFRIHSHKIGVD